MLLRGERLKDHIEYNLDLYSREWHPHARPTRKQVNGFAQRANALYTRALWQKYSVSTATARPTPKQVKGFAVRTRALTRRDDRPHTAKP